jgi:hypothetical protein
MIVAKAAGDLANTEGLCAGGCLVIRWKQAKTTKSKYALGVICKDRNNSKRVERTAYPTPRSLF